MVPESVSDVPLSVCSLISVEVDPSPVVVVVVWLDCSVLVPCPSPVVVVEESAVSSSVPDSVEPSVDYEP